MKLTAAVITVSDKGYRGQREDTSGPALKVLLEGEGYQVLYTALVPDEKEDICRELLRCSDELGAALVLTTGGTGFSPRDVTPEAALSILERQTPGIPEAMRAESCKITPKGCLSRSVAGIRGRSLIITLPGSKKAALENIQAVLGPIRHGLEMLQGEGSADCASPERTHAPSIDAWLKEAKAQPEAGKVGMYLTHSGVVRTTAKAQVRQGETDTKPVAGMAFSYDREKVDQAVAAARAMPGIYHVRVWLNEGVLPAGEDLMQVLIGGDIRPHVVEALETLVGRLKAECITEQELYEE